MGKDTGIEWTHHTFNPFWGCTKVSPGCANCYAESFDKRVGGAHWGPGVERRTFGEKHWNEPRKWNAAAAKAGERHRVFCASMADVFDVEAPAGQLDRLWALIRETPHLDWLLLTKRPERIAVGLPADWGNNGYANVWLGTSVEDQPRADERIAHLIRVPAVVRFLSMEPLLGPVDLTQLPGEWCNGLSWCGTPPGVDRFDALRGVAHYSPERRPANQQVCSPLGAGPRIDWVIVGGESGPKARPMHPDWARAIRDQCAAAGVAFLFKQHGEHAPYVNESKFTRNGAETTRNAQPYLNRDGSGGDCWVIDSDLTWSNYAGDEPQADVVIFSRVGKHAAGRLLDGRTWDGYPTPRSP